MNSNSTAKAMTVIPVFKLGTLVLRTVSKPIANRLKQQAGLHPRFRDFIVNIAQANHRFSATLQRRLNGVSPRFDHLLPIRQLNEEKAVQAAADMLGEVFVFTVAGLALVYEVHRNSRSEARKEEKRKQEMEAVNQKNQALSDILGKQSEQVELLKNKLAEVEEMAKGCRYKNTFSYWQKIAEKSTNV